MKAIAFIAVAGIILLELSGAVPQSSVGGPMALAIGFLIAAMAAGIHEAWTAKRGVFGWIVSIFVALVGGILASMLGGTLMDLVMETVAAQLDLQGSLAETRHPLLYVLLAAMMLLTLAGAWIALRLVNRMR